MNHEHAMTIEASIHHKLQDAFAPSELVVVNESDLHHGHASSPGSGQSHFRVLIKAPVFAGLSRVERHRRVNAVLADEFGRGLHALSLQVDA